MQADAVRTPTNGDGLKGEFQAAAARPNGSSTRPARRLRIAQLAPLFESVPPKLYGGSERVVSNLTEELVRRGHRVTLFASGDSETSAELVPCSDRSLRLVGRAADAVAFTTIQLGALLERSEEFDIVHNHIDYFAFPFSQRSDVPMVTTAHGRMDLPEVQQVYRYFSSMPLVSISDAQREFFVDGNWVATIYNGIDFNRYSLHAQSGDYLAFLGRISPEKRPDRAIEIAREVGLPLKIAAKVDTPDRNYFEHAIKPLLDHPDIEFVGEITDAEKDQFLGNARAYLFPIDWPEPFGLTMVESMACGTPVIAMACGSVREVVTDGVTGFICRSYSELVDATKRIGDIDRAGCRARAQEQFDSSRMADGYETLYRRILAERHSNPDSSVEKGAWSAALRGKAGDRVAATSQGRGF